MITHQLTLLDVSVSVLGFSKARIPAFNTFLTVNMMLNQDHNATLLISLFAVLLLDVDSAEWKAKATNLPL